MERLAAHDPLCRYRLLVEGTTDYAIFTTSLEGLVETWNAGAARIFGYESDEILGQNLECLFTPEDRAREVPALERRYATETGRASDHRWHVRKDRSRFWASGIMMALRSPAGTVVGLAKFIVDATETRRAEDALAASEHQFRALVTASPLSMLILNVEGWPLTANPAWERRWNTTVEALQASPRCVPERFPEIRPYFEAAVDGETVLTPPLPVPLPAGEEGERWMRAYLYPLRRAGGEVGEIVMITEDITDQRRVERATRDAQRLESLGVLAGGLAHDFNNLLTGILGNASLALHLLPPDSADVAEMLQDVVRSSERAAALTRQILAYAGKGRLRSERIDVCSLLRDMTSTIESTVPSVVSVEFELEESCAAIAADPIQIRELILNLVANGVEAIGGAPGVITVSARNFELGPSDLEGEFTGFELAAGTYVRLTVADSGSGMDRRTQSRIFDPFFTTKFLGRGLGLAASLGIVRGHRGAISVHSVPGAGSTFSVLLPAETGAAEPETREPCPPGSGTVLVVDDEPSVRRVAAGMLAQQGYEVMEAATGSEAVGHLRTTPAIRAVLLDLSMPGMSGEETAHELRQVVPELPIIIMSGHGDMDAMARFAPGEVAGFVSKPFTPEGLAERVAEVLRIALP